MAILKLNTLFCALSGTIPSRAPNTYVCKLQTPGGRKASVPQISRFHLIHCVLRDRPLFDPFLDLLADADDLRPCNENKLFSSAPSSEV